MAASGHDGHPGRLMSRRQAVRWLAVRAAAAAAGVVGLGALARLRPWAGNPPGGSDAGGGGDAAGQAAGGLVGRAGPPAQGGVQVFRSRPDLHPPAIEIDVPPGPTAQPGLIVTDCHYGPGQQGPLLIDGRGDLVWFLPLSADATPRLRAFNVQVQSYLGEPVLAFFRGAVVSGHGEGHYELYDSRYRPIGQVYARNGYQGDLHEFFLTDRATAVFTCYGTAAADLSRLGGPKHGAYFYGLVQEVDVRTGRLLFQWRSDEHVPLDASYEPVQKATGVPWDYFHINSIGIDPSDGNLIVSGRNTWAFYKVDRASGAVLWQVGGKSSTYALEKGARFAFQHHVRRWPDGSVTIFDNEAGPPAEASQSRALVLSLDDDARTATMVAQYHHTPPVLAYAQGSVQDLARGHRFIGWGDVPYFTEFDAAGRAIFDGRLAPGTESYRAFKQAWQGTPVEAPAVAVEGRGTAATVYASWNGATEVARWAVLGGEAPAALRTLGAVARVGFETAVTVPRPPRYLAVEALDGAGRVLGRSAAHRIPG